ncbi:MAG: hypothetical protein JO108_26440 [Acidobacteriaceae bacterium]|nr:hypothetical protein [Acidobacteriaceae bacterium]
MQGELTTREYDRTIQVPSGKKTIEHVIQLLAVELKADTIRLLDRTSNSGASEAPAGRQRRCPSLGGLVS